ncbi:MAG: putative metal-binding motif-containing protein [Deltaproteobacteria bacterium]|nr:putative metal-binding motif-containing protein [Deltaproteobacteria bacterium]
MNEKSGYHFARSFVASGTEVYVFDHGDGASHVAFAWRAADRVAQDARLLLGIPANATTYVMDHLEHPLAANLGALDVGPEPIAVVWANASLDADLDGYPRPVDCNDLNALVSPGLPENQGDSLDNDCNAVTPPGTSLGCAALGADAASGDGAARAVPPLAAALGMIALRHVRSRR